MAKSFKIGKKLSKIEIEFELFLEDCIVAAKSLLKNNGKHRK